MERFSLLRTLREKSSTPDGAIDPPEFMKGLALWVRDQAYLGHEGDANAHPVLRHLEHALGTESESVRRLILLSFFEVTTSNGVFLMPGESPPAEIAFVNDLVRELPDLSPVLDAHLEENDGDLSPYSFFPLLVQWAAEKMSSGDAGKARVIQLLARFESEVAKGDSHVKNLIVVGFLEDIPSSGEPFSGIENLLGPRLKVELDTLKEFWGYS